MKVTRAADPGTEVPASASPSAAPSLVTASRTSAQAPLARETEALRSPRDFRAVYDAWFEPVSRWVRALGGRDADRDDILQEIFLVVRRRLPAFEGDNLAPWLYRITQRRVRDFARRSWVARFFNKRSVDTFEHLASGEGDAHDALERREEARLLEQILGQMREVQRVTFVLFEIEGLSGEEIATLQQVPLNTVWTRLHHARRAFEAQAARLRRARGAREEARRWGALGPVGASGGPAIAQGRDGRSRG